MVDRETETALKEMTELVELYKKAFHLLAKDYHDKTPCLFEMNEDRACGDCTECVEGNYLAKAKNYGT